MIGISIRSTYRHPPKTFEAMESLPLTPLPSEESHDAKDYRRVQNEGFVDESVVLSVIAKGPYERVFVKPEDMVLSSSTDDFAGWALPIASPFRDFLDVKNPSPTAAPRVPAELQVACNHDSAELGLAEPHRGSHRWWLLGLSSAVACGILSLTLLNLAHRTILDESMINGYTLSGSPANTPEPIAKAQPERAEPALVKVLGND